MTHSDWNEAVEAAAKAMFENSPAFSTTSEPKPKRWAWEMIGEGQKEYWRELARVAYRHFTNRRPVEPRQEGMVMVPREPTNEMLHAGAMAKHSRACDDGFSIVGREPAEAAYRAMLAAAPQFPEKK